MTNIIIIHGTDGDPEENWFPWLKDKLEKMGHNVYIPQFPIHEKQNLNNWKKIFMDYEKYLNENTLLIGHSLGPSFILDILQERKAKAAYMVSGFIGLLDNPFFDKLNKTFTLNDFNWKKIRENCDQFYLFHGDNDPYVSLGKAKDLSEKLETNLTVIKNGGHLNVGAGFTEFELLFEKIKENL